MSQPALWFGLLGGPIAWIAHLLVSFPLVPLVCATGLEVLLYGTAGITALVALAAGFVAWQSLRRVGDDRPWSEGATAAMSASYLARSGIYLSLLFLLVIVVQSLPMVLQGPCQPAGSLRI